MYSQENGRSSFKSNRNIGSSFHFKTKRVFSEPYYEDGHIGSHDYNKENYFVENAKFSSDTSTNTLAQVAGEYKRPLGLSDSNSSSSLSTEQYSESKTPRQSNSGLLDYKHHSKGGLNKLSNEYVPNYHSLEVVPSKLNHNLNCSETVIVTKGDSNFNPMISLKCSKSGRIPNGLKYKTELCTNFMEGRQCPFASRCRFAHGYQELNKKFILNKKFRSKVCEPYHKQMFCKYGSRCLFRHYNFEKEFYWSYYTNTLQSGFLLKELVDSRELYKVFRKLRIVYKGNHNLVAEKLILTADPNQRLQSAIGTEIYKRLPVFSKLTEGSDEFSICTCTSPLTVQVLIELKDSDCVYCKCYVKDFIFEKVLKVIK